VIGVKVFVGADENRGNSSACNCALAARLAANGLEQPGIRPFAAGKL